MVNMREKPKMKLIKQIINVAFICRRCLFNYELSPFRNIFVWDIEIKRPVPPELNFVNKTYILMLTVVQLDLVVVVQFMCTYILKNEFLYYTLHKLLYTLGLF